MRLLFISLFFLFLGQGGFAQDQPQYNPEKIYRIVKTDGNEILCKILSSDKRELLILTKDGREIYIPQYVVESIEDTGETTFESKIKPGEEHFATRHFITTNGLPLDKGEHYVQWNLFGPDFQFGVADNLGVGIMTSWVGMPLIGSIKYSWRINDNINMAAGGLVGTGSWAVPEVGGALSFASITFGDRTKNLTLTGGYGGIFFDGDSEGRGLCSVAGMAKISKNISLVFDSFIVLPRKDHVYTETFLDYNGVWVTEEHRDERQGGALFIPGIRWHQKPGRAFQFGFSGLYASGEMVPFPIPMVQWYRSF